MGTFRELVTSRTPASHLGGGRFKLRPQTGDPDVSDFPQSLQANDGIVPTYTHASVRGDNVESNFFYTTSSRLVFIVGCNMGNYFLKV